MFDNTTKVQEQASNDTAAPSDKVSKKVTKKLSSTRKTKVIGEEDYINTRTGETQTFNVVEIDDVDANFEKLWLGHILAAIDEIGNAKMKILNYILENREKANNSLIITIVELAEQTGVSRPTVTSTLQVLEKHGIIKRKTGAVILNPDVVFKGRHKHRMNVLYKYNHFTDHREV
jgi:Fic family protein